jgi:hypothetical protein
MMSPDFDPTAKILGLVGCHSMVVTLRSNGLALRHNCRIVPLKKHTQYCVLYITQYGGIIFRVYQAQLLTGYQIYSYAVMQVRLIVE